MSNLNFGSTAPSTGGAGFSFGNKPTTTTTTTGGFNFGTPSTTTGTTATTGGTSATPAFSFGTSTTTQPSTTTTTTGGSNFSFGAKPTGTTTTSTTPSTGFGFGTTTAPTTNFATTGQTSTTATAGTQQQQQIPQQINPKTPFKKLPNQFQRQLEAFEKHKNSTREKVQELVKQQENSNELIKLKQYRKKVEKKINAVGLNTEREKEYIETLKSSVLQETKNVEQAQNNFNKIISPYFNSDLNYTSHYFFNTAQKLEQQMQELWKQIEDISQTLSHSEMYQIASSGTVLQETFTSQQQSFLNVAARLAALHEKVNDLREMYIRVYQVKGDPFKEQPRVTSKQKPAGVTFTNINQPQTQQQGFSVPVTTNTTTSAPTTGFNFSTSNTSAPTTTSGTTGTGFNFNTGTTTAPTTTGTTTGTSGFNFGTNTAPTTGTTTTTGGNTGFNFSSGTTAPTTGGFGFGQPSTGTTGGFSFGKKN